VGFKDGIDLFGVGNLLSLEHATAGLIDHTVSQLTIVLDLLVRQFPCRSCSRGLPAPAT
jgi:hypothetical protein